MIFKKKKFSFGELVQKCYAFAVCKIKFVR